MEELGISELTSEQIEELCVLTEEAARKYVLSQLSSKNIEEMNISIEAEGIKPVMLIVDVDVVLSKSMLNFNVQKLVDEAVKTAFEEAENYLRKLGCHS